MYQGVADFDPEGHLTDEVKAHFLSRLDVASFGSLPLA
jgi:hypothetical protein